MDEQGLTNTARALMAGDRGLLAMDESTGTSTSAFLRSASRAQQTCGAPTAT